jgi:hypothetical protein
LRHGGFAFNLAINLGPLTARLKSEASWRDEYPAWQDWADECESLLTFLSDGGVLERFWPRLCAKAQQRDETINEIRVGYLLHLAGYPVVDWEPQDAGGRTLEYAVAISQQRKMLVEVKSPGWEAQLSESERKAGRASQPKYRADIIEGGPADPVQVIRRTVEKARPKFSGNQPGIVVPSDDCRVNLGEWGWGPLQMALSQNCVGGYGPGLFHEPAYSVIGAVCLFWSVSVSGRGGIEYHALCMRNPNAVPTAVVPQEVETLLTTKPLRA